MRKKCMLNFQGSHAQHICVHQRLLPAEVFGGGGWGRVGDGLSGVVVASLWEHTCRSQLQSATRGTRMCALGAGAADR